MAEKKINLAEYGKQSRELILKAVLEYVKEQTPEICMEAVKENGWALKYVEEQTPEICLAAVMQNGLAIKYVKKKTLPICIEAVNYPSLKVTGFC